MEEELNGESSRNGESIHVHVADSVHVHVR